MTELVDLETGEIVEPMTKDEASMITNQIRTGLDAMAREYGVIMPMIREALTREAYAALGYKSAGDYISREFGDALERLGVKARRGVVRELRDAGMSTRAIAPVVGVHQTTVTEDLRVTGEGCTSPKNVVGIDGKAYRPPKTNGKRSERLDQIRELADKGWTSDQIADKLGVGETWIRRLARQEKIIIPADRVLNRTRRRIDHNRIAEQTVTALEALASGLQLLDPDKVDPAHAGEWATSLTESLRTLTRFATHVKDMAHAGHQL